MWRKLYMIGRDFSRQMKKENISAFAASTAFFLFLSLVPMLILICAVIPYTPLTEVNLVAAITEFTPDVCDPLVENLIGRVYRKSASILSVAAIATLWSAGKGVLALMRGLNAINDVEEKRNYFMVRSIATLYTAVMLLVMIISLFIMVFGNQLVELALHHIPQLEMVVSFCMNFRFMLAWVVLTLMFAAIYAFVPDKKLDFREQLPGAAFSAVVWSVFSWGFSIYVRNADYSIYGSLAMLIIVMVWMYFCMYIIFIGAYWNRYFTSANRRLIQLRKKRRE